MLERFIQAARTEAPAPDETPAALRDRLKPKFPPGATRRMTLLGMMVGATLRELPVSGDESIVYTSMFGESPSLEAFLEGFPNFSPLLFQTSIHPSAVQQNFLGAQRSVRELLPMAGRPGLTVQAALAASISPAAHVIWCGGDERGTWLREAGVASERSFAFALKLARARTSETVARLALRQTEAPADGPAAATTDALPLPEWFDLVHTRTSWHGYAGCGWQLELQWL